MNPNENFLIDNITNIHPKLVLYEINMIDDMDKITLETYKNAKIIHDKFKKLNQFYEKILVNTINSSNELPYYYNYHQMTTM